MDTSMPKMKTAKNAQPARIGEPIDLKAWIVETEKDKDGKDVYKNVKKSEIMDSLKNGKEETKDGRIVRIVSDMFTLNIELAKRRIPATKDGKPYEMEYANLLPNTVEAAALLVDGNADVTYKKDEKGKETDEELPSIVRYFKQGYGMLARNNASSRIATVVEGPDKALEQAIKSLMKAKGWSREKAEAKAKIMFAED